ncbi:MAG: DUF4395 domain-containing protein [Puniceicoccales bacterium]|jgi:hypothetical protein|nr:DUF4395 domain-containing protein [Puniceicoccales bacterium]
MLTCAQFEAKINRDKSEGLAAINQDRTERVTAANELLTKRTSNFFTAAATLVGVGSLFLASGAVIGISGVNPIVGAILVCLGTAMFLTAIGSFCYGCWLREQGDNYAQMLYFNERLRRQSTAGSFGEYFTRKLDKVDEAFAANEQILKDAKIYYEQIEFCATGKQELRGILQNLLIKVREINQYNKAEDEKKNKVAMEKYEREYADARQKRVKVKKHNKPIKKEIKNSEKKLANLMQDLRVLELERGLTLEDSSKRNIDLKIAVKKFEISVLESTISGLNARKKPAPKLPIKPLLPQTPLKPEEPLVQAIESIDSLKTLADLAVNKALLGNLAQEYGLSGEIDPYLQKTLTTTPSENLPE